MAEEEHDLLVIAKKLRYDLTAMQVKVSELIKGVAALNLPVERFVCPTCKLPFKTKPPLDEHLYHFHDGPEPPHWLKAEEIADEAV